VAIDLFADGPSSRSRATDQRGSVDASPLRLVLFRPRWVRARRGRPAAAADARIGEVPVREAA
jgi:hypothetical protein